MRHLKRFKNWLAAVYYAFRQQDDTLAEATSIETVECGSPSVEVDEQPIEVSEAKVAIAEPAETVVAKVVTPEKKVAPPPQQPKVPQVAKVQPEIKVATPKISTNGKSNGTKVSASHQAPISNGKYQPGAINDQTAQRLARLLVSEIKLYYKSKSESDASLDASNIYDILREPIEKSRAHYNNRMGKTAIETMPDYFHGELVKTLCGGDASRLGPNYPTQKSA